MLSLSLLTSAHNTRHKKLNQDFSDVDREENGKSELEKFVVVGTMFTPSLIDVVWGDVLELACCSQVWRSEEPCNVWGRRGPTGRNVGMIWKFQPIWFHVPGPGRVRPRLIVPGMMITSHRVSHLVSDNKGTELENIRQSGTVSAPHCKVHRCTLQSVAFAIVDCQETDAERLPSPWRDQCLELVYRGPEIGSLIKLSRLSLPSHAALTVLGHTGSRERIGSNAVRGKRPGKKTRSCSLLWSVLSVTLDSWLGLFMIYFLQLVSFCWN